jgi:transcriptional regulator with XRE-family HTH domain
MSARGTDRVALGVRLKNAREYRGFSQEDVATFLSVSRSAISLIESGDRRIDAIELSRLANLFNCSIEELTTDRATAGDTSSIEMVARLAAKLSEQDRAEVVRFAEFLSARKPSDR